jgi:hypothetical protein
MKAIGVAAAVFATAGLAVAVADETSDEFDKILRAIQLEREKLKSGVLRLKGTQGLEYPAQPDRNKSESFEIFMAFDVDHVRFDMRGMGDVLQPDCRPPIPGVVEQKRLRTKNKIATARTGFPTGRIKLFDIHALGIRGWVGPYMSLEETLESLLNRPRVKGVDRADAGRVQIVVSSRNPADRVNELHIWLSPDEGYSATRSELLTRLKPNEPGKLAQQSNTEWHEGDGVWVPVHHHWSSYSDQRREFLDFNIAWESINKPIDPKWFAIELLGPDVLVENLDE